MLLRESPASGTGGVVPVRDDALRDYRIAFRSRQASLVGRASEVLTGKAKFGIFGDGKEVAQLAMARAFRPGDFRSGYYRDQTLMFALGMLHARASSSPSSTPTPTWRHEPASGGRQMNAHFATRAAATARATGWT